MDNLRMDRRPNVLPSPRELLSGANPEYPQTHPQSPNYGNASPMDYTNNGGNPQYSYQPHLSFALHPNGGSLPNGLNSGSSDSEKGVSSTASTPIHEDIDPKSPFAPNGGVHSPIPHNPPHHQYSYPGAPRHPHDDSSLQSSMSNMSMSVGPAPSPPIPTGMSNGNDPFQQRPLPPLEPNHHLYPYSAARRGSITDPALHLSGNNDFGRRYSQPDVNLPMPTSSASPLSERRGSVATDYSSQPPSPSLHSRPGPLDNRPDLAHMGRRESLPSIALPPGSGPMFDPFQRRHSIAVTEMPFQSSASNSPTSPFRRKVDFHFPAIHENERRNSYSAPSSPPVPSSSTSSSSNSTNNVLPKLAIEDVDHSQQPSKHLAMISEQHAANGSSQPPSSNHHHISPRLGSRRASMLAADSAVPIITRRASMPAVPLSRHHGAPDGYHDHDPTSPGGTMPMELDKYRSPSYLAPHHGPHPYAYPQDGLAGSQGGPGGAIAPSPGSPSGSKQETPYSRSPELRVSHKLAERKRRKEMKELFDELRDSLPVEKSMKTSKWEILTKAVDYIGGLKQREVDMEKEIDALRREVASLKQGRS